MTSVKESYNIKYQEKDYFYYRKWLFSSYIAGLISLSGLKEGSTILDAACGQGFFSQLFHGYGLKTFGIDISEEGISSARDKYGSLDINFLVGDILTVSFSTKFDCVFTRGCSLYNTYDFPFRQNVTEAFLSHVKPGGTFIFAYYSKPGSSKKSESWLYHTLGDVKKHFSRFPNSKIFFTNRIDTILMKKYSFNPLNTRLNLLFSKAFGLGGDLVCIVKKTD